ncbi:hypothetical protein KIN20_000754 [Parelaphostrongylus tenuis]|uniref:Choline transporter-like protein n=1 Tax=Parelaphostrongylus tenuis TaxID=148309 RepID=A0AAD5ME91_PARTN|nr:hypothetical protein KIN20_000754 [Parelaphostrongylus tenuis]
MCWKPFGCCVGDTSSEANYEDLLHKGRRSCTDCSFLVLFIIFCGGLGCIAWYAMETGDPYRVIFGSDSFGNTCGRNNGPIWIRSNETGLKNKKFEFSGQNMTERKFMFPLNVSQVFDTIWVCVRQCPQGPISSYEAIQFLATDHQNSLCADYDSALNVTEQKVRFGVCPHLPVLKSVNIMNRCIPENLFNFGKELIKKVIGMDLIRGYLHDIIDASPYLLQMCLVALGLSLLLVFLLRFFAAAIIFFVYSAVVMLAIGFSASVWYVFWRVCLRPTEADPLNITSPEVNPLEKATSSGRPLTAAILVKDIDFDELFNYGNITTITLLALCIAATVISVFVVSFVWCVFPRSKKMVRLFKGASLALSAMPSLLLQPLLSAIFILILVIYTISVVLVLFTAGDLVSQRVSNEGNKEESILIIETNMTRTTKLMMFYQFVGFVWVSEFLMACQRLFIAGAVSMYYFDVLSLSQRFASATPRSPVRSSLFNLLRYHLGSAALGAFIIVLVRVPRYIIVWSLARMRSVENVIIKQILSVFILLLSCIENCLQYINYNVFTVISYSGLSFCPAAKMAVNHLLDNAVDVAALNSVGDLVLFLTKCLVGMVTAVCAYLRMEELWPSLSHPWFPLLIMFVCSYQIANCFLSVYEMAIDTIMLCCAEELVLLRDNPEMAQQFRDYIDGTTEVTQNNVRFLGSKSIEETYPLGTISNKEQN